MFAVLSALDFRYTLQQIRSMSRRDISVLIAMLSQYKSEQMERNINV